MNIGLDIGYSATKGISGNRRVAFPSACGTPEKASFSLNGVTDSIILVAPEHVQVGAGAVLQSEFLNRREDRHWITGSDWYNLALAGITELTSATLADLVIVTGLPVAFYGDRQLVRDRLLDEHRVQQEGRRAQVLRVSDCRVIPQPFGALLAATLDSRGNIADKALATGAVGIVDIGGKTTNLLSVNRLSEIGRETESVSVGAWNVVKVVRAWLSSNYPDLDLRDHRIMDAVVARQVSYFEETVDLSEVVESTVASLAQQVLAAATQLWNGGATLSAILVSGGGAKLMGKHVERHFRHARIVADPVFANALGFWRFAQYLERQ